MRLRTTMTAQELKDAWDEAQSRALESPGFYTHFQELTGISQQELGSKFKGWNLLSNEEAVSIAQKHGFTVREGGFQAYLAETWGK